MTRARVGTSGWRYPPWRRTFYPEGLPQRRELEHLSRRVDTIEINGSFYSLQRPESWRAWAAETPDDFVFAVKGPRFVTHMKQLRDVATPVANFLASGMLALGPKLGPVLWQLPPRMRFDAERMAAFLALLPRTTAAAARLAEEHDERLDGRALTAPTPTGRCGTPSSRGTRASATRRSRRCCANTGSRSSSPTPRAPGPRSTRPRRTSATPACTAPTSCTPRATPPDALDAWAERVRAWLADGDVFVYFDNDAKVHAPYDALALAERL